MFYCVQKRKIESELKILAKDNAGREGAVSTDSELSFTRPPPHDFDFGFFFCVFFCVFFWPFSI